MKNRAIAALFAALAWAQLPAMAEDIDLFVGAPPVSAEVPNVLIVLDNTGNWSAPFANEKAALVSVFNGLPVDKFRVGLMLFTETGSGNTGNDGGYVRAAIRQMSAANKTLYSNMINSFDDINDRSNSGKAGKTMAEAYYYFAGAAPYAGNNKNKTDYAGNTYNPNPADLGASLAPSRAVWALSNNALPSKAGSPYVSPVTVGCAKNFIIWISNGAAQDSNADTTAATTLLANAGGSTTAIPISPSGSQTNVADEWARFMKQSSLGITTYTIDVNKVTTGQGPGWTALLKSMAGVSGGKYFDVVSSGTQILDALNIIFGEIQAVNSVFASVSLPATANTQSTFLNQIFIGMFRPDADGMSRWHGNLKQYRLGLLDGNIKLLDANPTPTAAINPSTGFITACARSYWTPSAVDTYWAHAPSGECLTVAGSQNSNYPDGPIVEKGAQGYTLRSTTTRTVHTCSATFASCTALTTFATTNAGITQAALGAANATERDDIINWARGIDNLNEDIDADSSTEMRPSVHGDVVHSRPVAINYGTDASPQVVVYYSGNDGMLRAINGNRSTNIGSHTPGKEMWSFVPPEFYGKFKRIRDNTIAINYPGSTAAGAQPKSYGIDGPLTAFRGTIGGVNKTFLYAGMRRGGRALYAFDVTTADAPTLKWKIGCPNIGNDTGCAGPGYPAADVTAISAIGQTWSPAVSFKASGYGSGASPMLIMGGGYDNCEDTDNGTVNHSCTGTTKGNRIFVLDANTGALLKTFTTDRGVVGGITVVPDENGIARYAYAADTGGNLYRLSGVSANVPFSTTAPASWTITKVASLGCATPASCSAPRKFLFTPDVVEDAGQFILILGSGDREKPISSYTTTTGVSNYFFVVRDTPTSATWLSEENTGGGGCGANVMCLNSLTPILTSASPTSAALAAKKGWYLGLAPTEQVVTSAITVSNRVTFSTSQPPMPDPDTCGNGLGTANVYNINYLNADPITGESRFQHVVGDGLPPSPVAGMVTLDDGTTVPFLIGGSGDSPLEAMDPSTASDYEMPKTRVYWHIRK